MKKTISLLLSAALICPSAAGLNSVSAENISYGFGDSYLVVKESSTSSVENASIGDTGFHITTETSNWNAVTVRDKNSTGEGLWPYGDGLPDNGYYMFVAAGGNNPDVNAMLTLPETIQEGSYVAVTYAKPYMTNNGSTNRSAGKANTMTIGGVTLDIEGTSEYDTWYTAVVRADSDISDIKFMLGSWSATAVSEIAVLDSYDMLELSAENDTSSVYIMPDGVTVQYTAKIYDSIIRTMDGYETVWKGGVSENEKAEYSVVLKDSEDIPFGVSIDDNGILSISPDAEPGIVSVSAAYNGYIKTLDLELMELGNADKVTIAGDELVHKGGSMTLRAFPSVGGVLIPERDTTWSIEGDDHGCVIENGVLTVPENASAGNITVKAVLDTTGAQTTPDIADVFTVTIADENEVSPCGVSGVFLKDGALNVSDAAGITGIAVSKTGETEGYKAVAKAIDDNGIAVAETEKALSGIEEGVSELKTELSFNGASSVKAYIVNSENEVVSDIYKADKGIYKNIPLVGDWITGAKSGLGMGAGIINPVGAPYGVDPEVTDVSSLNVIYSYDDNYPQPAADNALWYKTGAFASGANIYSRDGADWEEQALPIGNGYMAGMLFGMPDKDQIQFNEETFWAAGYRGVQASVESNNINKEMSEGINGYMNAGNVFVDFNMPSGTKITNYYRDLNLDEAVAHVQYEKGGVIFKREYFASYPKEVLVLRYTSDQKNALSFDVNPVSAHPGDAVVKDGEIKITGRLKNSEPYSSGGNAAWNQESDLEYCTIVKVIADDSNVTDGYNNVSVDGATDVTIIIAAATDYDPDRFVIKSDGTVDMTKTPYKSEKGVQAAIEKAENRINNAAALTYDELKAEHIADYKSQFDTVKFSLTDEDEICPIPTNELQASYGKVMTPFSINNTTDYFKISYDNNKYKELDKHLEELHYNYARYLMISSSRSTTMPANLQGKWCQSVSEIWGSCYCININMEMNYWFAGGANLLDSGKALIGWFESQIPAGRITAKNMYNVTPKSYKYENGKIVFTDSNADEDDVFIMHTKQAIMGTTDMTGSTSIQSPGNTAWLMYNLWDLYQTSGDKELLENELYPIMRKCANFYTQYIYTNMKKTTTDTETYPDGYYYTTWEGRSPEQGPTQTGVKYDLQLVCGMYDYVIAAAETLGIDEDKVGAWKEIRNHMETPVELGDDGQIKEWAQETTYNRDQNGKTLGSDYHRHISHLVALYPGNLINRNTPEWLEGAKVVLEKRGDGATGWSTSNKFLLWARTLEGDKALELFRFQLAHRTYANLFDTHAPFQIDGNFGSAAAVMELLMQSQTGEIYILPALPDVWDKGEISGIKAKNGAEISIKWSENKADMFTVIPAHDGDITIGYEKDTGAFMMNGEYAEFDSNGLYTIKNAEAGKAYVFETTEYKEKPSITLTKTHVTVNNTENGVLAVAGYNENGEMVKWETISSYDTDIEGYSECAYVKAFLWESVETMKPMCSSVKAD